MGLRPWSTLWCSPNTRASRKSNPQDFSPSLKTWNQAILSYREWSRRKPTLTGWFCNTALPRECCTSGGGDSVMRNYLHFLFNIYWHAFFPRIICIFLFVYLALHAKDQGTRFLGAYLA